MNPAIQQFRQFWERLEAGQKRSLVIVAVLSFAMLAALGLWANRESYVTVLRTSDVAALTDARASLDEQGIPYEIDESGSAILARSEDIGRARIASAGSAGTAGLELLSELQLGTTPQQERWAYQRALQGELERTISGLDEVQASRVHLVLQERSAFLRDDKKGTASVTVKLRPGAVLSKAQVRGITALVAGAIDGIEASDVVLVDDSGALLSSQSDAAGAAVSGLLDMQSTVEARYAKAIEDALLKILGSPEALSVAVTAELSSRTVERTVSSLDPQSQVTISEQVREEDRVGKRVTGGVPGTDANLATGGGQAVNGNEEERNFSQIATNYDYTRTQERELHQAGELKRLAVGVTVNQEVLRALVGEAGDTAPIEAEIQRTIQAAMGYDEERGDQLNVSFVPYFQGGQAQAPVEVSSIPWTNIERLAPTAVAGLAVLLFFAFVVRPVMAGIASGTRPDEAANDSQQAASSGDDEPTEDGQELATRLRRMVDDYEHVEASELNKLVELEDVASAEVLRRWIRAA